MAQIYYYDPQSARINVQSPQSESTSRRLTLVRILQEIPVAIKQMAVEFFNSSGRNSDRKSSRLHLLLRLQNMKKTSQL